jgi:hypothetical protein
MRFRISLPSLLIFYLSLSYGYSQGLSAYVNVRNAFYVFDDSITKQIDYLKPKNFKIGGNCVAFISNDQSFKVYQNGRVIKVNDGFTTDYTMTGNYVVMKNNTSLHVYDNGKATLLARNPMDYVASDSIIGFSDPVSRSYFIYSNGNITPLTYDLIGNPINVNAVGKNLLAYTTLEDSLKIYYRRRLYPQPVQNATEVSAGKNIVAYKNNYDDDFKVFYKGAVTTLETFPVRMYFVGDDLVTYVTSEGNFKIFYDGRVYNIGKYYPGNLQVIDNLVVFSDELGFFNVFYKGKKYQLERYMPDHIEIGQNSIFYIGQDNRINLFSFGKQEELPFENYVSIRMDYDVLQVETSPSQFKFYYKGKIY